ncbi:MAG TPA: class I SAM-dependent methyltransferase [Longimicrobium sp.]|jgi:2-polyprenyl-3-methyl-5-hydroxy-6-metoxy-1,4-benzoquinol methylase
MTDDTLRQIERSWETNAAAWTEAVRDGRIATRRLVTDQAVVDAVLALVPRRVLDLGCGEGWLARALAAAGVEVVGVDASAPLVEAAREAGCAEFHVCSYAELAAASARLGGPFDVVVANFSLLGDPLDDALLGARALLKPGGTLIIQTVHPWSARGDEPYRDGWRTERFAAFGSGFTEPMPWYYRTLESSLHALRQAGLGVDFVSEPLHPETGDPASLILIARAH